MKTQRWTYTTIILLFGVTFTLLFQNCGKPTDLKFSGSVDSGDAAALESSSLAILSNKCYACHNPGNVNGDISNITDVTQLLSIPLVIPGEPEISKVVEAITAGRMPPPGNPGVSGSEVQILKDWIIALEAAPPPAGTPPPAVPIQPRYADLAARVFGPRCVGCHGGRNFRLNSYAEILRVVTTPTNLTPGSAAGNAAAARLYIKVTTGLPGQVMPIGGTLTMAEKQAIFDWIQAGALNN